MTGCRLYHAETVALRFYGELSPDASARFDAHLAGCAACRQYLDDLGAIRAALSRPQVDAPPAGDWSGFTRRLDAAVGAAPPRPVTGHRRVAAWVAIAATLAIVSIGVLFASRFRTGALRPVPGAIAASAPAGAPATGAAAEPTATRSLVRNSEEHLERSKVVVLGLATRDPHDTDAADWAHERELANSLLPDTQFYRLAAERRGMTSLARVMGDLETVLLETSMSDDTDPQALERLQRLIARRDLMVKMNVVGAAGI